MFFISWILFYQLNDKYVVIPFIIIFSSILSVAFLEALIIFIKIFVTTKITLNLDYYILFFYINILKNDKEVANNLFNYVGFYIVEDFKGVENDDIKTKNKARELAIYQLRKIINKKSFFKIFVNYICLFVNFIARNIFKSNKMITVKTEKKPKHYVHQLYDKLIIIEARSKGDQYACEGIRIVRERKE
jgi:hypothetical protein